MTESGTTQHLLQMTVQKMTAMQKQFAEMSYRNELQKPRSLWHRSAVQKNGTDAEICAVLRAEPFADADADFCADGRAEVFAEMFAEKIAEVDDVEPCAELHTVVHAVTHAETFAETAQRNWCSVQILVQNAVQ